MKKYTILLLSIILILCTISLPVMAAEPIITVTKSEAYVTDAPANSDLIVALYQGQQMNGLEIYQGTGTIYGNYAKDMAEELKTADSVKAFLWNISAMTPLIPCFSSPLADLPEQGEEVPDEKPERALVLYFSCTGNTETLAEKIHNIVGGNIDEIIPVQPYTSADLNYSNSNCRARREINSDARPAIEPLSVSIEQYDVILLGYPIWWGECPPAVRTFMQNYDLSGKTILPFCTSGSTGISGSLSKIRTMCPNSIVTSGFRGTASASDSEIRTWLNNNHFSESIATRMKLKTNRGDIIIKLNHNSAARNLANMLPMELNFSDFNGTEKIAYPPETIDFAGADRGTAPKAGDLTLYAPWGNLALFYHDWPYSNDLISLGSIESGAEYMTFLDGTVRVEQY